jgi:SAM-dependent methyltransferase
VVDAGWTWDSSLYAGSAAYYVHGRVAYPPELAERLTEELSLDGTGQLLDVGCGPGSLTLLLAGSFERATGVDADAGMLVEARRQAADRGIANTEWLHLRAEDLPESHGPYRLITLAQAFHWMDRPMVARRLRAFLQDGGALAHVHATTHRGVDTADEGAAPSPPWDDIERLIQQFLGTLRRAGQGTRPEVSADEKQTHRVEDSIYREAGFTGPTRLQVPARRVVRTTDEIVASTFSLSYAAPHLFGERRDDFEAQLRDLLAEASPSGEFGERMREIDVDVWRV